MSNAKIPQLIRHILDLAKKNDLVFSDIHIEEGEFVMMRTPAGFVRTPWPHRVLAADIQEFLGAFNPKAMQKLDSAHAAEEGKEFEDVRLRISAYLASGKTKFCISVRVLPPMPPTLEETGLPNSVFRFASQPRGLLLVTGPTGAGKSTTCGAYLREINATRNAHVVTVEDPIEYVFKRDKAVFSQRHVGVDVVSYAQGLHEALRQRPDVILIGEIRDRDTAETVLRAADSGHFVIASMHARSTASALAKFVSLFEPEPQAAARILPQTLVGVISQCLVPSKSGNNWLLAAEVLAGNDETLSGFIAQLKFKEIAEYVKNGGQKGSTYMNKILANMVNGGQINREDAIANSPDQFELLNRLSKV